MNNKVPLSFGEIKKKVQAHLGHLLKSAREYDQGDLSESVRMAVSLRSLLHINTKNGRAGIANLDGERWHFLDTSYDIIPGNLVNHLGLVCMRFGGGGGPDSVYQPHLDAGSTSRRYPFPEWWDKNIVLSDLSGRQFTRAWIVKSVADQEGAHIDIRHEEAYHHLNSGIATPIVFSSGEAHIPIPGLLRACTRQIAHEALRTFRKCAPDIFPQGIYPTYDQLIRFSYKRSYPIAPNSKTYFRVKLQP